MQNILYESEENGSMVGLQMFKELNGQSLQKYEEEKWFALQTQE